MNISIRLFAFMAILFLVACSDDDPTDNPNTVDPTDPNITIWTGADLSFEKQAGSDPSDSQNQDRITDNVWITRGNNGGQIFNARTESSANKDNSPAGTRWAIGTTNNLGNLTFERFRDAIGAPKDIVGVDMVLHLVQEDIYLDIKFTSWSQSKAGGFAYERSTPN